jgi:branched-chain amino acid transport system substrate-binding protein
MALDQSHYRIGDYNIEPVWIDEQSDPVKASRAYEEAVIRDKIQAGILNWHSSVAVACMDVAAKFQVPHFFGVGATEIVNQKFHSDPSKYGYWMAKMWPVPAKLSISYVKAIESAIKSGAWHPGAKTLAIYGEDTDWGRSLGAALRTQFEQATWQVVAEEYFSLSETEFYPLLNKLKNLDASLLAGTSTAAPTMSAFIKQAREVGLRNLIIADGLGWVGEWHELTGDASDGVVDQNPRWTTPAARAFRDEYTKRWNDLPSPSSAGLAFDSANLFLKLAQATLAQYGALNKSTIYRFGREKLWTGEFTYSDGVVMRKYQFTPETIPDPVVGTGFYMFPVIQYQGGEGMVIWPPEWKEKELQAPGNVK